MSLSRFGEPCEPSWESFLGGKTPEPTHVGCPGGSNTPGLIGGWTCPCDCHASQQQRLTTYGTVATTSAPSDDDGRTS